MEESFQQKHIDSLYNHLNKKFVKLEISEGDFEKELTQINYPTKYCNSLYQLFFKEENLDQVTLNKAVLSSHSIFNNKIKLVSLFVEFDEDNNQSISHDEFRKALKKQGFSESETASMFEKIDEDGNGDISFLEFTQFFEEMVVAQAAVQDAKELEAQGEVFTSQSSLDAPNPFEETKNDMNGKSNLSYYGGSSVNGMIYDNNESRTVKDDDLRQLLYKFENNEMHFSNSLLESDNEILLSLIEMIQNLAKDRTFYENEISDLQLNSETLAQECEMSKSQNLRIIQENELLNEQMMDLKREIEQQKEHVEENSRILRAATNVDMSGNDVSAILNRRNSGINGSSSSSSSSSNGNDTSTGGNNNGNDESNHKQRRSSLLNDNEIQFLTNEYEKQQNELTELTLQVEKKQNEMKQMTREVGQINKLEKENGELSTNLTKLTNKFEKDIKKLNKSNKKIKEENVRMKEYIENVDRDIETERQKHTQEIQRLSIQVQNTENSKKAGGHARNDTAVGLKRRMKTMNLNDMFDNVNGGIESLFDAGDTDTETNAEDPDFDDPFLNSGMGPDIDELEQNLVELENENDDLTKQIEKQKTENFESVDKLDDALKELETCKAELEDAKLQINTLTEQNETFVTETDQKIGKMAIDDESENEELDNKIDINPQNVPNTESSFCAWICCGVKIM